MSKTYEKSKFIEYLRETPLVSFACKKVGLSRATYYRWVNGDKEFRDQVQKVLRQGRDNINDLAEATLIKMIKSENFNATRFWLQNNNKRYVPIRTTYVEPQHDHRGLKAGETCTHCGSTKPKDTVSSNSGGGGFYERDIEEKQKQYATEAKKRRKMSGQEKKALMQKMLVRKNAIEAYEKLGESFPEFKIFAKNIKNGTMEPPAEIGVPITKRKSKIEKGREENIDENTLDRY
jgi:hypothetical protein